MHRFFEWPRVSTLNTPYTSIGYQVWISHIFSDSNQSVWNESEICDHLWWPESFSDWPRKIQLSETGVCVIHWQKLLSILCILVEIMKRKENLSQSLLFVQTLLFWLILKETGALLARIRFWNELSRLRGFDLALFLIIYLMKLWKSSRLL